MIAGARHAPHPRVDSGFAQARRESAAQESRLKPIDVVRPPLGKQPLIEGAGLWLQERVLGPRSGVVDVEVVGTTL